MDVCCGCCLAKVSFSLGKPCLLCIGPQTYSIYGRRSGAVADAVRRLKREWLDLLEGELRAAGAADPADDAFRIDAFLCAANTHRELFGRDEPLDRARDLALEVIGGSRVADPTSVG